MIELNFANGGKVCVAPEHIVAFHEIEPGKTVIYLSPKEPRIVVQETPDEILKLLPPKAW
jgi:hypothetical protein